MFNLSKFVLSKAVEDRSNNKSLFEQIMILLGSKVRSIRSPLEEVVTDYRLSRIFQTLYITLLT